MARPRKPTVTEQTANAALLEKYKDFAGIAVIERRLDNPDLPGSLPIRLKGEPTHMDDPQGKKRLWYLRWVNGGEAGRFAQVTDVMGYVPVKVEELQNPMAVIGAAESKDGIVRRGDRGQEVLVKMPAELYIEIKARQQEMRERRGRNARLVKSDLANAAGAKLGDEAGQTIQDEFSLTLKHHRGTLGGEMEEYEGDVTEA